MKRINDFAAGLPWLFSLAVTIVFILMVLVSAILGRLWPGAPDGQYAGGTFARLVFIGLLLLLLRGLGWLEPAGFTRPGRWQVWLFSLLALTYAIAVSAYALTGNLNFRPDDSVPLSLIALFITVAAFLEEIAFRGLILHDLVRVWGDSDGGSIRCVLVSSLFFAAMHLVNVLGGQPLAQALGQAGVAFFLGVFLACLVLAARSIYPAVFFHGTLNLAGFLNLAGGGEQELQSWLMLGLLMIPLAAAGIFLLRSLPSRVAVPDTA